MPPGPTTKRQRAALAATVCVPLGLGLKGASTGGLPPWVADHLAGSIYVLFWCFVVLALRPSSRAAVVISAVVLATCGLEFLQLSDAEWLVTLQQHPLGGLLLGSTFSWIDLPFYALGGALAGAVANRLGWRRRPQA